MVGFSSAAAAVYRRQDFLIRCLGGYSKSKYYNGNFHPQSFIKMQSAAMSGVQSLEADATSILRSITPTLDPTRHKGQAGKQSFRFCCQ